MYTFHLLPQNYQNHQISNAVKLDYLFEDDFPSVAYDAHPPSAK